MLALLDLDLFPGFAMDGPWLSALASHGENCKPPPRLAWIAEDAIVLAPYRKDHDSYGGFLIALASAIDQEREFVDEKGTTITLMVPRDLTGAKAFASARANVILSIVNREN